MERRLWANSRRWRLTSFGFGRAFLLGAFAGLEPFMDRTESFICQRFRTPIPWQVGHLRTRLLDHRDGQESTTRKSPAHTHHRENIPRIELAIWRNSLHGCSGRIRQSTAPLSHTFPPLVWPAALQAISVDLGWRVQKSARHQTREPNRSPRKHRPWRNNFTNN
jgi:hypothetical protein